MCGVAGLAFWRSATEEQLRAAAERMGNAIRHRGPDDVGTWIDAAHGVALVHRRLSIIDLSPAGHQPMQSASGRYLLSYNGEIYNYRELRQELDAHPAGAPAWRGTSDTEVLLAAFERFGIEQTLRRAVGMFAIALWDRAEQRLTLARDRLGEKPMYYGWTNAGLLFGSELKAVEAHPAFSAAIDRGALSLLLRYGRVPAPHSIYQGIRKLPPGCLLQVHGPGETLEPRPYWSAAEVAARGLAEPFRGSADEAVAELERHLVNAVRGQMVADVPLGAFLSGGVDSSTIVALMQEQSSRPVRTFSIGFDEPEYDEAVFARDVAKHIGTEHTELYVSARQAQDVVPELGKLYDEPFADSSQIPTVLVSRLAREHVTVSLSGDAGDELFGGYSRYAMLARAWRLLSKVPPSVRRSVAQRAAGKSPAELEKTLFWLAPIFRGLNPSGRLGDRLAKAADMLCHPDLGHLYRDAVSHWKQPGAIALGGGDPSSAFDASALPGAGDTERMMFDDLVHYLPDDILVKVDRATMSVSLESRIPLLDHRLVEFAWTLPMAIKQRDGVSKWPLRQILYKRVPQSLIDRPKRGFSVPVNAWLRGPLREWAEDLLSERKLGDGGFFDVAQVRARWTEHLGGERNWQASLWDVLMFQAWRDGRSITG